MSRLDSGGPSRRARLLVAGEAWSLNVLLLALLCGEYVDVGQPQTLLAWLFVRGGQLSCAATLSLVPGLVTVALAALWRSRWGVAVAASVAWSATLFAVYVDTRIYGIFRYHFNGLVWNVLTTPGADEAVHFARSDVVRLVLALVILLPLEAGLFLVLWRWIARRDGRAGPLPRLCRPTVLWSRLLVPTMLAVAGVYAHADLVRDPHVMAFARTYPVYPRVTVKRFARALGLDLEARPEVEHLPHGILLDYPREVPWLPPSGPAPDVVVVVIDSLRADMLDEEVMPNLVALAREGRTFRDHLSGGNATRFGLFGLLYGLHGSYWKAVLNEHRSPVLVDALLARGYAFRVLTSASMDYPEFRSTAWVRIEPCVEDRLPAEREGGRDDGVARRFEEWMDERAEDTTPAFAFLLLDAPHQSYAFPEASAKFRPYLDEVAYASIGADESPERRTALFNRYRNAVHYSDEVLGRVLAAIASRGRDTVVLVTGDHGEEFFENGFWGHTSNFTRAQAHVPLVLAGPGVPPGEEHAPTSHVDVPGTLLELLGADPAQSREWTLGTSLLAPSAARARVIAGWDTLGLHVPGAILEVGLASYGGASLRVYDAGWTERFDDAEVLEQNGAALGQLALECRRFLK